MKKILLMLLLVMFVVSCDESQNYRERENTKSEQVGWQQISLRQRI